MQLRPKPKKKEKSSQETAPPAFRGRKGNALTAMDPLQLYLNELRNFSLLTREEEIDLASRFQQDNDQKAAAKLVVSNLRLVVKIALDYQRYWARNLLDLIQEGNLGLMRAIEKYDPYRGIKFSYYASFWIRAYVMKFILDNWRLVKIGTTQNQRKLFFGLERERRKLLSQGISPEPKLLADRLNVKKEEVIEMAQRLKRSELSLDSPLNADSATDYAEVLPAPGRSIDEVLAERQQSKIFSKKVKEFSRKLSGREAEIFRERFMVEVPATLQEIGDRHHISRERVRQIQDKTIRNLRAWLNKEIPEFEKQYAQNAQS